MGIRMVREKLTQAQNTLLASVLLGQSEVTQRTFEFSENIMPKDMQNATSSVSEWPIT